MKINISYKHKFEEGLPKKEEPTSEPLVNLTGTPNSNTYQLDAMVFVPRNLNTASIPKNLSTASVPKNLNTASVPRVKIQILPGLYLEYKGKFTDNDDRERRDFEVSYEYEAKQNEEDKNDYDIVYFKIDYTPDAEDEKIEPLEAIDINLSNILDGGLGDPPTHTRGTKSTVKIITLRTEE